MVHLQYGSADMIGALDCVMLKYKPLESESNWCT